MSAEQQVNRNEAQAVLETEMVSGADTNAIAEELFGVADLLDSNERVARSLTDPSRSADDKVHLAKELLSQRVQLGTLKVIEKLVSLHWRQTEVLVQTLERLAIHAVLEDAFRTDQLWQVEQELRVVYDLFRESRDLRNAVASSYLGSSQQRAEFISGILDGKVLPVTKRLVMRAVQRTQSGRVLSILMDYAYGAVHLRGQYLYTVSSAQPLSEVQFARLHDLLQKKMNKPIVLTQRVDPDLIGGFRVTSANHVVEASVLTGLLSLRQMLKN